MPDTCEFLHKATALKRASRGLPRSRILEKPLSEALEQFTGAE
jgi:hypothetical protein